MLMPKQTKHRKHAPRAHVRGVAKGGTTVNFGEFGLQALEARTGSQPVRSRPARVAITRAVKRGGKVWITIFPDKPVTQKPAETRMGSGKGNPEFWVAVVKPGRVMFELAGVPEDVAREAMRKAEPQASDQDAIRQPGGRHEHCRDSREMTTEELLESLDEAREEKFNLRFQLATNQLDNTARVKAVKKDIARILTEMRVREMNRGSKRPRLPRR